MTHIKWETYTLGEYEGKPTLSCKKTIEFNNGDIPLLTKADDKPLVIRKVIINIYFGQIGTQHLGFDIASYVKFEEIDYEMGGYGSHLAQPITFEDLFKFAYFEDHKGWRVADFKKEITARICSGIGYGYGY